MTDLITISDGDSVCTLRPDLGGSIISWSVAGQDMLRRAGDAALASGDPLSLASFPLVPFSNRIGFARFNWNGQQVDIEPNFPPEPHAIHGIGWTQSWEIGERSPSHCALNLMHSSDERWPWFFSASQKLRLTENGLELQLNATNLADEPVPLAFGHHPYFDQAGAELSFNATSVFMSDALSLPTHAVQPTGMFDFSVNGALTGRDVDHCYAGWDGHARITWSGRPMMLDIKSDMKATVVYVPKDGNAFCFEPVPHINNALNRPGDILPMPIIAPGESFNSTITFEAIPK